MSKWWVLEFIEDWAVRTETDVTSLLNELADMPYSNLDGDFTLILASNIKSVQHVADQWQLELLDGTTQHCSFIALGDEQCVAW
jgi:hypothetical protein